MIGHHPKNGIENSSSQTIKTGNALEGAYPFAEHDMDEFSLPLYWFTEKNCKEVVVKRWDEIPYVGGEGRGDFLLTGCILIYYDAGV